VPDRDGRVRCDECRSRLERRDARLYYLRRTTLRASAPLFVSTYALRALALDGVGLAGGSAAEEGAGGKEGADGPLRPRVKTRNGRKKGGCAALIVACFSRPAAQGTVVRTDAHRVFPRRRSHKGVTKAARRKGRIKKEGSAKRLTVMRRLGVALDKCADKKGAPADPAHGGSWRILMWFT
jgi:hypothetical protein